MYSRALTFIAKLKTYHEKGIGSTVWTPAQLKELIDEVRSQHTVVDDLGRLVDAERQRDTASRTQTQLGDVQSTQTALRKALEEFQDPIQEIHDGMIDLVRNLKGIYTDLLLQSCAEQHSPGGDANPQLAFSCLVRQVSPKLASEPHERHRAVGIRSASV
ncbi:hypothetical protein ASPVEDRAFT_395373 [Aspergillus versicolor CBS 583.65]|uniref:Uncharacterized protein n=1 Tax=Aspergillus versicolor CBS 583.65 TaxID=1036611 RepID=A0A1L9Q3Y2_ASPVE|nr:uncharacterized protein ASPVEDRAFT_395373 [Aspergillus versicolor CBS 583.65]OJJ08388.1 hypothetical protein ASPVEDRAFT_395373 [Aspergillus versicolor CBS 583.65]